MATYGDYAAAVMRHMVNHDGDDGHGYTQGNRWGDGTDEYVTALDRVFTIKGGDRDCSSAIISAWEAVLPGSTGGATYTGNMRRCFTNTGLWEWQPMSFTAAPGDVYLNEANHTSMCLTQAPDTLLEFSISENGTIYGRQGDQTGWESREGAYYDYPWDGILHFVGDGAPTPAPEPTPMEGTVIYEAHTDDGWLGAVRKADDTDDGFAGWSLKPIDGVRAYRTDGQPLKIQTIMDDGNEWSWTTFNGSLWGENAEGDGYAGDIDSGHYIIGLRVFGAKCRVKAANGGWLGWTEGDNPTPEGDDFAGEDLPKRVPITAVQMML